MEGRTARGVVGVSWKPSRREMTCSRWRSSPVPRKLGGGGWGRCGGSRKRNTIIVVHPPSQEILPSPPASSPSDGCCPFPQGPQSATVPSATCTQSCLPLRINHVLNIRAGPSAHAPWKEKTRSSFPARALIYTPPFMVSVGVKAEFVFLQ